MKIPVTATAEAVTRAGYQIPVHAMPRHPGDPARLAASPRKIERDLRWKPEHDNLHEITSRAWQWHPSHPKSDKEK